MNRSSFLLAGALSVCFLLPPSAVRAAGWTTTDRSVVAMGAGGTGAARGSDAGANAYNPAAGLLQPGLTASLGVVIAAPVLSAEGAGVDASARGSASVPPHLHVRWAGETFGLGASLTVPFGSRVAWPEDWAGRFDLLQANVTVLRTSAFVGARFGDIAVAAGPFLDNATLGLSRALDFIEAEGRTSIETRATGVGGQAAVLVRLSETLDVGLSYQSRVKLAFDGYADFTVPPELRGRASDGPLTTSVVLPDRFLLGAAFRATDELELFADLELTLWGTVDQLVLDFENEAMTDVVQARRWKTTLTPRLGAAWRPTHFLEVRAGAFLDPSPVPASTVGPSSPDSTRVGLTAGAGLKPLDFLSVDLGYQLALFTGAQSEAESLPGVSYGGAVHLIGASVTARVP